jgi:hypothetical protein
MHMVQPCMQCILLICVTMALPAPAQEDSLPSMSEPLVSDLKAPVGEWNAKGEQKAGPFRGCIVNRTYSAVTLTIVRSTGTTALFVPPGAHLLLYLDYGSRSPCFSVAGWWFHHGPHTGRYRGRNNRVFASPRHCPYARG